MLNLNSRPEKATRGNRRWRLPLLLLAGLLLALVTERWRGQWALSHWKSEQAAQGEVFEIERLWPPASDANLEFSNRLAQASASLMESMTDYAGQVSGIIMEKPGRYRRGSQEPRPTRDLKNGSTNTWQDLDDRLQQNLSSLQSLRELMKHPPPTMGSDVARSLFDNSLPSFFSVRVGAQVLQAAAMNDLHNGDHETAMQDLETLLSFAKLYELDPSLSNYMLRMAILGLGVEVWWDALQADGWTELQLARLQRECLNTSRVLSQLPRILEAERASRIYQWELFRSHSYQSWITRCRNFYQRIGLQPLCPETASPWQQWLLHPLWSFAWADQEELAYLRQIQVEVASLRDATKQRSWLRLKGQVTAQYQAYGVPAAAWRFYTQLPLMEHFSDMLGAPEVPDSLYPYSNFSRGWFLSMMNLTQHEMVITAIALKRYGLKHGRPPARLAGLVPEFLPTLPTDLMDGQPLRYRLNPDDTYVLYSVGANLRDDGGDFVPESTNSHQPEASPWNGLDWVWPQLSSAVKNPQCFRVTAPNRQPASSQEAEF